MKNLKNIFLKFLKKKKKQIKFKLNNKMKIIFFLILLITSSKAESYVDDHYLIGKDNVYSLAHHRALKFGKFHITMMAKTPTLDRFIDSSKVKYQ